MAAGPNNNQLKAAAEKMVVMVMAATAIARAQTTINWKQ
jgi:hypothetical protein